MFAFLVSLVLMNQPPNVPVGWVDLGTEPVGLDEEVKFVLSGKNNTHPHLQLYV